MEKGDTVVTLNGQMSGRITDLAKDEDAEFVELRPMHQPYGPGVWHAADHVMWMAAGKQRKAKEQGDDKKKPAYRPAKKK